MTNIPIPTILTLSYSITAIFCQSTNSTYSKICRGDLLCGFINQINSDNKTFEKNLLDCKQPTTLEWANCFSSVANLNSPQAEIFIKQANWTNVCKTNFTRGLTNCEKNCKSTNNTCSNTCVSRVNSDNHGCIALYARVSNDTLFKANKCAGFCPINKDNLRLAYNCIIDCESQIMKNMHIDVYLITSVADAYSQSSSLKDIKLGLKLLLILMIHLLLAL
ncbi:hypothetical protein CONCODRAFT_4889 [Conidiobolus coronatus NRRL 28638]|uniref:Uncharacterized protein n=1 Tax=Conidiobolus coronatus (strain ATCC 28846 / CBS 209.66 / NRRL 28638) TaxID=796925 RepID=A0A137PBF9_CONC2|nr:hypothetical protein CONCODRAFT_4889 [Conidiobolus coronatus NRRL 28638]|eukprot:KXN72349.1 hypothetical protein CONCODRAFT_4889 [Conidiobolus coronatus NRRL 28638]